VQRVTSGSLVKFKNFLFMFKAVKLFISSVLFPSVVVFMSANGKSNEI